MRILLIFCLFLMACTDVEDKTQSKTYYDLAGLLNQQINVLSTKKPMVDKLVRLADKQEHINTRDIDWNKELELFLQADLNKQSYQAGYIVDLKEKKVSYQLKEGEKLPVKQLTIVFDEKGYPKHIEAYIYTSNYLYNSEKKLTADLINNLLYNYKVEGSQQLFIGNKKVFSIEAKIKGDYQ